MTHEFTKPVKIFHIISGIDPAGGGQIEGIIWQAKVWAEWAMNVKSSRWIFRATFRCLIGFLSEGIRAQSASGRAGTVLNLWNGPPLRPA